MEPTRKQYLAREVTHEEYYRALAKTAGIDYSKRCVPRFLDRVRAALDAGDHALNSIPLYEWDKRARMLSLNATECFRKHGDTDTLAGRVCLLKQAARDATSGGAA